MEKTKKFVGKNIDLDRLSDRIGNFLMENNYEISSSKTESVNSQTHLIQARKRGIVHRTFGTSSTDVIVRGNSYEFEVSIEPGVWRKTLNLNAPLSEVSSFDIVAKSSNLYPGKNLEEKIWPFIQDQIDDLDGLYKVDSPAPMRVYPCDYIEGYSGWKYPILHGKLLLEHQQGHRYLMFRMGADRGVMIPPLKIIKAEIISKKTKISNPDRIVRFTFRDEKGKKHKPIFNFEEEYVKSVFAGINEIVTSAKQEGATLKAVHHF